MLTGVAPCGNLFLMKKQRRHPKAIRFTETLHKTLDKQAERRGWTLAYTAERLLEWALAQPKWSESKDAN